MTVKRRPVLVLATGNAHKVREISEILHQELPGLELEVKSAADWPEVAEPEETGETFEENALIKARYWARATGLPALADDSGLVVDALEGRPGVRSARYAETPELRIHRVLEEMREIPPERRRARFVCIAALADPVGGEATHEGRLEGWIAREAHGNGGFGYDPVFEPDFGGRPEGRTLAEYDPQGKNRISHRGKAIRGLAEIVGKSLRTGRVIR